MRCNKTHSKQKLIDAAIVVFSEKGVEGASTRDIAKVAGVNHAAISYYFSGKEALYAACLDAIIEIGRVEMGDMAIRLREGVSGKTPDEAQCLQLLDLFIETMTRFFLSCRERIVTSRIVLRELVDPTPAFDRLYDGMMRDLHESLTRIVACLAGLPADSRKAIICAHAVMGQMMGFQNGRAIIERRLGLTDFSDDDIAEIVAVLKINTHGVIAAWRKSEG
jgi:AcrR family transcriptional regulator